MNSFAYYCYQESANISTDCGGLNTGLYGVTDANIHMNYTIPESVFTSDNIWTIKHGGYDQYNITIPVDCIENDDKLKFLVISTGVNPTHSRGLCLNNSDSTWIDIANLSSSASTDAIGTNTSWYRAIDGNWSSFISYGSNVPPLLQYASWMVTGGLENSDIYEEGVWWNIKERVDNCTTYNNSFLNFTLYRNIVEKTLGNVRVNISFDKTNFSILDTNINSLQLCTFSNSTYIRNDYDIEYWYNGDFGTNYIYNNYEYNINYSNDIYYINLTVPKLFLNFSESTDIIVKTVVNEYYFDNSELLMAMTNLSIGKVSVIFNNGTQYFEYYNDLYTYIDEDLHVINNADTWVNMQVKDTSSDIITDAYIITSLYDINTNTTRLVSQSYDNLERRLKLKQGDIYNSEASAAGYSSIDSLYKPEELQGGDIVLVLGENQTRAGLNIWSNYGDVLPFTNNLPNVYNIKVSAKDDYLLSSAAITWYVDDVLMGSPNPTRLTSSRKTYSYTRPFYYYNTNMTVSVNVIDNKGNSLTRTFFFKNQERYKRYETSFYQAILYDKFAFAILLIFVIGIGLTIQSKFRRYGIDIVLALSVIFSFINLYMIIPSVILTMTKFVKKSVSDDA